MPFQKGQSGFAGAAGKVKPFADAIKRALAQYENNKVKAGEALRAIADKLVAQALEGDKHAIEEIANRLDGKPHVSMDVSQTVEIIKRAADLNDDELASIAAGGGSRIVETQTGSQQPNSVH